MQTLKTTYLLGLVITFFSFSILNPSKLVGQCTVQQTNVSQTVNNQKFGQSFKPTCTGPLNSFTYVAETPNGTTLTVEVREGIGCDGNLLTTESITQVIGSNVVSFSSPPNLTSGEDYSVIFFTGGSDVRFEVQQSGSYLDGSLLWGTDCHIFDPITNWDMHFVASIGAAVAPIPTMGEWALILFGLIVLSFGVVSVMRWQKEREMQLAA